MDYITPIVQQWEVENHWEEIFGSDTFFTDFFYYHFFTWDGLTRTLLFYISVARWEWGNYNYQIWYGDDHGYGVANWFFSDNFLLGWLGFMIVAFMRPEYMWIFVYALLFETSMKLANRYYGSGYGYYGYTTSGNDYRLHYDSLTWTTWALSFIMYWL